MKLDASSGSGKFDTVSHLRSFQYLTLMTIQTNLKVAQLLTYGAATHQYNQQLVRSLREQGVAVNEIQSTFFLPKLSALKPDILHIHWLHHFTKTSSDKASRLSCLIGLAGLISQLLLASAFGIRIVWTVHELEIPESHFPDLDRLANRLTGKLSHCIVAHCSDARKEIVYTSELSNPSKIKVVPHGHFIESMTNEISRDDARRKLSLPEQAFVVLFFGWIRPYKGVRELIESHKQLARDDVFLMIVGSPVSNHKECREYSTEIERSVRGQENIRLMLRYIGDKEIQTYMNASDVVAFPYRSIMTSGAVIAAMGFGKPCIAPRLGCVSETLDEDGAFLYDARDNAGLLKALNTSLASRDRLPEMGQHNLRLAQKLDWSNIAELTLQAYRNCTT